MAAFSLALLTNPRPRRDEIRSRTTSAASRGCRPQGSPMSDLNHEEGGFHKRIQSFESGSGDDSLCLSEFCICERGFKYVPIVYHRCLASSSSFSKPIFVNGE